MEQPFTESDLSRLKEVVESYHRRTGTNFTETQMGLGLWLSDTVIRYHFELCRCVLMAYDTKQPFLSHDLENLVQQIRKLGLRESKIEADLRRIVSTARQFS